MDEKEFDLILKSLCKAFTASVDMDTARYDLDDMKRVLEDLIEFNTKQYNYGQAIREPIPSPSGNKVLFLLIDIRDTLSRMDKRQKEFAERKDN